MKPKELYKHTDGSIIRAYESMDKVPCGLRPVGRDSSRIYLSSPNIDQFNNQLQRLNTTYVVDFKKSEEEVSGNAIWVE